MPGTIGSILTKISLMMKSICTPRLFIKVQKPEIADAEIIISSECFGFSEYLGKYVITNGKSKPGTAIDDVLYISCTADGRAIANNMENIPLMTIPILVQYFAFFFAFGSFIIMSLPIVAPLMKA